MSSTGLVVAAVVLVIGTAAGLWRRRTDGRLRSAGPVAKSHSGSRSAADPADGLSVVASGAGPASAGGHASAAPADSPAVTLDDGSMTIPGAPRPADKTQHRDVNGHFADRNFVRTVDSIDCSLTLTHTRS